MHLKKLILAMALTGCSGIGPSMDIAPDPSKPNETVTVSYGLTYVKGFSFVLLPEGRVLSHGGPIVGTHDEFRFAVKVHDVDFDLVTVDDAFFLDKVMAKAALEIASQFCASQGWPSVGSPSADAYTRRGDLYLMGYCAPP